MRRFLSLLSVGVCAVAVAVSATTAADIEAAGGVLPSAVRLHNVRPTPQQALQSRLLQQRAMQDPSFAPLMTYAEVPSRTPRPLYEAQWDLEDFHSSGAYDQELAAVITNTQLYAQSMKATNNSLWVFDVDETTLSGYSEMQSIGFGFVPQLNNDWIMKSNAPAIPQSLALYKQLVAAGFRIVFLTGRKDYQNEATALNLRLQGYDQFEQLITRTPAEYNLTATVYKSNRRTQLTQLAGYNIVGCVGDQWSDLNGPYTGMKVKLPNYIYYLP